MPHPKVFIIILNWNGLKDTLECLESVFKLDYPNFEVIVVDNGSTDNSVEVIRKAYPQVILIENKENLGYAEGNNVGIRYALKHGADYVWLLNNDTVVEADVLIKLVTTAESSPKIGLASPVIYYYNKPDKVQFCGSYIDKKRKTIVYFHQIDDIQKSEKLDHICLWGTALLVKKSVIMKIGYLNEEFFAYWEDTEYSVRALEAGFKNIIVISSKVYHKKPLPESKKILSIHYYYYMTRNEYFFWMGLLKKHEKLFYFRRYIAKVINQIGNHRRPYVPEVIDAYFEGAYSAIYNIKGPRPQNIKIPEVIKKIILWHPYFWYSLLEGDFKGILKKIFSNYILKAGNK